MNKIMGRDVILPYPNFSAYFIIHTYDSKMQLRGVMIKNSNPVDFYSCKLNPARINYTTIER